MVRSVRLPFAVLLAATLVVLLTAALLPPAAAGVPASGVTLTLGSDGTASAAVATVDPNGSALRYAMDGNFAPLVALLPGTNLTRATLLAEINLTESNPFFAGLFGDHDGQVDAAVDVPHFESLITSEARVIPVSTVTGLLNITLDAKTPTSESLQAIAFTGAEGPDASAAPIGITATVVLSFPWSGTGVAHTFELAWNLPSALGNLSIPVSAVNVSFATPAAVTITSVTGLTSLQVSNDPLGWGSAHASGQYTPLPGHDVVVRFGPAFPTGYVIIGGLGGAAVAAGLLVWLVRRRRRRRGAPASPPPGPWAGPDPGVGPSSGSG